MNTFAPHDLEGYPTKVLLAHLHKYAVPLASLEKYKSPGLQRLQRAVRSAVREIEEELARRAYNQSFADQSANIRPAVQPDPSASSGMQQGA